MSDAAFTPDSAAENAERQADPTFDRAMNAFWRAYHTEGRSAWSCVRAALDAANHSTPGLREKLKRLRDAGSDNDEEAT